MRRWRLGVWAAVMLFAVAFGSYETAEALVRVGYSERSDADVAVLTELKRAYEQSHPGSQVQLVPLNFSDPTRVVEWFLTGSQADLFLLPIQSISYLKGTGALQSLTGSRWHGLGQAFASFPSGMRQVYADGRGPIGVPVTADVALFQYNGSLLEGLGLPPLSDLGATWDWHQMIDVGRRVHSPQLGRYLVHMDLDFVAVYFLAHGEAIGPDGRPLPLINESNVGLLGLAQRAIHEDRVSPPPSAQSQTGAKFQRGLLGMRQASISDMQPGALARSGRLVAGFEWDVVPLPLSPFTFRRPAFGEGSGLVAARGATLSPDLVAFLEVAATVEGQRAVMRSRYAFPASPLLWEEAISLTQGPPRNRAAFVQAIQEWTHFAFPQAAEANLDRLVGPLAAILEGNLAPKAGLRMIQIEFDELFSRE